MKFPTHIYSKNDIANIIIYIHKVYIFFYIYYIHKVNYIFIYTIYIFIYIIYVIYVTYLYDFDNIFIFFSLTINYLKNNDLFKEFLLIEIIR